MEHICNEWLVYCNFVVLKTPRHVVFQSISFLFPHSFSPSFSLSLSLSHPSLIMFDLTFGFLILISLIWLLFLSSHPSSSLSACPHLPYYDVPQGSDLGPFSLKLFYFCIISSLFVITKIHTEPMTWTNMYKHLIYASSWRGLKILELPFWQKSLSMRLFISDIFFLLKTWLDFVTGKLLCLPLILQIGCLSYIQLSARNRPVTVC